MLPISRVNDVVSKDVSLSTFAVTFNTTILLEFSSTQKEFINPLCTIEYAFKKAT